MDGEKKYPVPLDEVIRYMDMLAIACIDEPGKQDLMGMVLSVVKYLRKGEKMVTSYDDKYSCNKCGGITFTETADFVNDIITECTTKCKICGFADQWITGHFLSREDGFDSCATYDVGGSDDD